MARSTLPIHPRTGLQALGYRKSGQPIWPILGGSEPPTPPVPGPPAPPAAPTPPDKGFPDNTPVAEMSTEQQAAYWKYQSRRHEDRVKAFGGLTPEQLTEMREKAQRADALEFELMSDKDRAVAEAATHARLIAEAEFGPRLVSAEFRAAAAGRLDADRLATILEPLDMTKFFTDTGDVDTAKVHAFIDGIAPATGTPAPQTPPPRGPSPSGLGHRPGSSASPSVASGRDLYASRHRKQT